MPIDPTITVYVTLDLLAWQQQGTLILSPKFQRRNVWSPAAKSSFLDTVLLGYPVPPLHLRIVKDPKRGLVREVIDGQQRLRALLGYIAGEYKLSPQLEGPWAGKFFDELRTADREQIEGYKFQIFQYIDIEDRVVLEIFSRINTYSMGLNSQELRYGKYFGEFKQSVYSLAHEYLDYWRDSAIFSERAIARMSEAQLVGELLILQMDGLQDKKKSLDDFYRNLDESWSDLPKSWGKARSVPQQWLSRDVTEERFHATMWSIRGAFSDDLGLTEMRRVPLFYTLFAAVYHRLYGLPGATVHSPLKPLGEADFHRLRRAAAEITGLLKSKVKPDELSGWRRKLVMSNAQQTDNLVPRQGRFDVLWELAGLGN